MPPLYVLVPERITVVASDFDNDALVKAETSVKRAEITPLLTCIVPDADKVPFCKVPSVRTNL